MLPAQVIARRAASYLLKQVPAGFSVADSLFVDGIDLHRATLLHWDKKPGHELGAYESCGETFRFATENDIFQYVKEALNSILLRLDEAYNSAPVQAVNLPPAVVIGKDGQFDEERSVAPAGASTFNISVGGFPLSVWQYYKSLCDYSPRPDRDQSGQFILDNRGVPTMRTDGCTITVIEVGIVKQPETAEVGA